MFLELPALGFMGKAMLGGVGIATVTGPLGSMMVWRRMSNFGDTLAHSTLLGVCFALLWNMNLYLGLIGISVIIACLLTVLSQRRGIGSDALLAMLSHTTLAVGLILATALPGIRMDLLGLLYGDILAINGSDLVWIYTVNALVLCILLKLWPSLLSMTIDESLAAVEGVPVFRLKWVLMMMMAIVFAIAMKLIGVLLMTALLVIPAAAARQFSKSPEQMAVIASVMGMISVVCGISLSDWWDWPAGPAIVVVATLFFIMSLGFSRGFMFMGGWVEKRGVIENNVSSSTQKAPYWDR